MASQETLIGREGNKEKKRFKIIGNGFRVGHFPVFFDLLHTEQRRDER